MSSFIEETPKQSVCQIVKEHGKHVLMPATHFPNANFWFSQCDFCGWVNTEEIEEQIINKYKAKVETMIKEEKNTSENSYFYDEDNYEHQEFEERMQSQYETMGESYHGGRDSLVDNILSKLESL